MPSRHCDVFASKTKPVTIPSKSIQAQRDLVLAAMTSNDRRPFAEAVTKALLNGPKAQHWRELASKAPDKWARALTELGKLSGFTEKQEVRHNVAVAVVHMSDSQIMQRLAELHQQLANDASPAKPTPTLIEHEPQPASTGNDRHEQGSQ